MRRSAATLVAVVLAAGLTALPAAAAIAPSSAPDDQSPPPASSFQKVTLNDRPGEPMSLAVLPDLRVLHTARTGQVRIHDPRTGLNTLAAEVPIYQHDEEGLQGIAIDPDFSRNHWVYLYYSPPLDTPVDDPSTPEVNEGDAPFEGTEADFARFRGVLRLSRFKLVGNELDLGTEQQIIDVAADRGICCHVGGQIDFDGRGNLFLSTGDDTNPFFSDGYAPLDDRPGRNPAFDARRSAATPTTCAASCCASASRRAAGTRSRAATSSRQGHRGPVPRSTPWACATRSGSRSTVPTATSTWPTTHQTPPWPTRCAGRPVTAGGC
jgi:cytochrome c